MVLLDSKGAYASSQATRGTIRLLGHKSTQQSGGENDLTDAINMMDDFIIGHLGSLL